MNFALNWELIIIIVSAVIVAVQLSIGYVLLCVSAVIVPLEIIEYVYSPKMDKTKKKEKTKVLYRYKPYKTRSWVPRRDDQLLILDEIDSDD